MAIDKRAVGGKSPGSRESQSSMCVEQLNLARHRALQSTKSSNTRNSVTRGRVDEIQDQCDAQKRGGLPAWEGGRMDQPAPRRHAGKWSIRRRLRFPGQ